VVAHVLAYITYSSLIDILEIFETEWYNIENYLNSIFRFVRNRVNKLVYVYYKFYPMIILLVSIGLIISYLIISNISLMLFRGFFKPILGNYFISLIIGLLKRF
jgi:hypothetical protein